MLKYAKSPLTSNPISSVLQWLFDYIFKLQYSYHKISDNLRFVHNAVRSAKSI